MVFVFNFHVDPLKLYGRAAVNDMDAYTSLSLHLKDRLYTSVAVSYGLVMYCAKISEGTLNLLLHGSHTINKTRAGRSSPLYIGALLCTYICL